MNVKSELKRPRGIGAIVGVITLIGGATTLVARRLIRRTRPWYERLGHTVTHDFHVSGGRRLRRLTRR